MRRLLAVALLAMGLVPLAAFAHTKDDEAACRPDVMRLCTADIPNETRIVACLARNKRQLSSACFRVFDRDPGAKPVAPVRGEALPHQWGR
jgi:hypothetical protein